MTEGDGASYGLILKDTLEAVIAFCESEGQPCESVKRLMVFAEMIGGPGAEFWTNLPNPADRTFEVRRGGKHVGFVEVTEAGEVTWL